MQGQQLSHLGHVRSAIAVGEEPVVADAVEAFGQHVNEEAADELMCRDHETLGTAAAAKKLAFFGVNADAERGRSRLPRPKRCEWVVYSKKWNGGPKRSLLSHFHRVTFRTAAPVAPMRRKCRSNTGLSPRMD
jgi:hypothetical protein